MKFYRSPIKIINLFTIHKFQVPQLKICEPNCIAFRIYTLNDATVLFQKNDCANIADLRWKLNTFCSVKRTIFLQKLDDSDNIVFFHFSFSKACPSLTSPRCVPAFCARRKAIENLRVPNPINTARKPAFDD